MTETKRAFRPVRCLESDVESLTPAEGYVLFTSDTHKIYSCVDGEYVMMGGSSGVYYGNRELTENEIIKNETYLLFSFPKHFDASTKKAPNVNDLILNIPDGGFYRVKRISGESIYADRIAVSGTGTGGSGDSGGSGSTGKVLVRRETGTEASRNILSGQPCYLGYEIIATNSEGETIYDKATAQWKVNGTVVATETIYNGKYYGEESGFRIDEYLTGNSLNEYTVVLTVNMDIDGLPVQAATLYWDINVIELSLSWKLDSADNILVLGDNATINYIAKGNTNCKVHVRFDDIDDANNTYFYENIYANGTERKITVKSQSYGNHSVEMWLSTEIGMTEFETDHLRGELIFTQGGDSTILSVPYYETVVTQYDTLEIPFYVYSPISKLIEVKLYDGADLVDKRECDQTRQIWNYTVKTADPLLLEIDVGNGIKKSIELSVNPLDLGIEEVKNYKFSLKASDFSGNQNIQDWSQNGINLEFSNNFDWENGGLKTEKDENGKDRKYICVKNGTTMTINYMPFGTDKMKTGFDFKFIFKATNCYDYDAQVLTFHDGKSGLKMTAQQANFDASTVGITSQYCEDSYIEFESEVWPYQSSGKNPDNFMMIWMDGIPAAASVYTSQATFYQQRNPQKIVIGSSDCDVYVYLVKVYEFNLSEDQHLDNFIMDAPTSEEILNRFNRNDILDINHEISPELLAKQNPNCRVYMYEIPKMTTNKKDEVPNCTFTEYRNGKLYQTADGITMKVQGTSSALKGVSAFNFDSKFENGFTMADGTHSDNYQIHEDSIPINYTTTKVNVASCENANNVVNADWYNKFQPYKDNHRQKNPKARDCMEFASGVVFIKDNNPTLNSSTIVSNNLFFDTDGYYDTTTNEGKYYKQYAIGNMGNSKKNIEVFHDTSSENTVCAEITDNQTAYQKMCKKVDRKIMTSTNDKGEYIFSEFRYPDGNEYKADKMDISKEKFEEITDAWLNFVNWMASCDPNPKDGDESDDSAEHPYGYTGEELPEPVTYDNYVFKGFGKDSKIKGTVEHTYAGTYTHDTKEYRIAKMLAECEDHLVMDSIIYHYLMIERHLLVDNVAKNTFWSSEDLIHWDLTKNYDNDTADGNDNDGRLTFHYGMETTDKTDDGGAMVFNAPGAVWLKFIEALPEARQAMYDKLLTVDIGNNQTASAWSVDDYLQAFKNEQDIIPERCWIYDYFRKYLRPYRLGEGEQYIEYLEGGKKTHQRKQFETYQGYYIDSKYSSGVSAANLATVRGNAKKEEGFDDTLTLKYYIDCYGYAYLGTQTKKERVKRGDPFTFHFFDLLGDANDAVCNFQSAHLIQEFSGIGNLKPKEVGLGSAKKLRIAEIGSDAEGYKNTNLTTATLTSELLEKVQVQNSGVSTGLAALNLSQAPNLKELYIDGSTYLGLETAPGATLKEAKINGVAALTMDKLSQLTEDSISFDEDIYTSLTALHLGNMPNIKNVSYNLALKAPLDNYYLTDIDWTITENSLNGQQLELIDVLSKLKDNSFPESTTTDSLTGDICIDLTCSANEYDIYKQYCQTYPNVTIAYSDKVNLTPAYHIYFYYTQDMSDSPYYVQNNGSQYLDWSISVDGPKGEALGEVGKTEDDKWTGTFTGYWIDKDTGKKYYLPESVEEPESGAESLHFIPNKDYIFYPEIKTEKRKYWVYFREKKDGANLEGSMAVPYEDTYIDAGGTMTNYWYKDSTNLKDTERYGFKGWTTNAYPVGGASNPKYIDLNSYPITKTLILYPYYEIENVENVSTNPEYFEVLSNGVVRLKEKNLKGKVTIPEPSEFINYTGSSINTIGSFTEGTGITHIFFRKNSTAYNKISSSAFSNLSSLVSVKLPISITNIGDKAFEYCKGLVSINFESLINLKQIGSSAFTNCVLLEVDKLPDSITEISPLAFLSCTKLKITNLPKNIEIINNYAFQGTGAQISNFGHWDNSKLTTIGDGVFKSCTNSVRSMVLGASLTVIGNEAFSNYGYNNGQNSATFAVYDAHEMGYVYYNTKGEETTYSNMGFTVIPEPGYNDIWED